MAEELRIPILQRTGTYLGLPSDWGRSRKEVFSWIIARVNAKLEGWKEQFISKGGKEILIKYVIQAIPQYAMMIFQLPISICSSIEKCIARFWWRTNQNKGGVYVLEEMGCLERSKDTRGNGIS